jgi:TRAP-type C4-dicarboxylate transport system substrate-binding protein
MKSCIAIMAATVGLSFALAGGAGAVTLKASHQFPGGKGDPRDEMVQIIAKEAKAANVDLDIQVYPGASLFKPEQQWNAMVNGQLDMTLFPLDYASGRVREFGATLMPGLVRNHERAARLNDSPFMKDIKAKIEESGVMVTTSTLWSLNALTILSSILSASPAKNSCAFFEAAISTSCCFLFRWSKLFFDINTGSYMNHSALSPGAVMHLTCS